MSFSSRFYRYFNDKYIKSSNIPIYNALSKYGFENFRLDILEYTDRDTTVEREQHYITLLKPEYNILKKAGSLLGFKHNVKTLDFFKNKRKLSDEAKQNLSLAASKRVLTDVEKTKLSQIRLGIRLSDTTREKISKAAVEHRGITVRVKNMENGDEKSYTSLTEAAKYLNVSRTAVKKALLKGNEIKNKFKIETN